MSEEWSNVRPLLTLGGELLLCVREEEMKS